MLLGLPISIPTRETTSFLAAASCDAEKRSELSYSKKCVLARLKSGHMSLPSCLFAIWNYIGESNEALDHGYKTHGILSHTVGK
jgi:hypothetical protein